MIQGTRITCYLHKPRLYIDLNNTVLDKLLNMVLESNNSNEEKQRLAEEKQIDARYNFSEKVRLIVSCGVINEPGCIYSDSYFGLLKGTIKIQYLILDQWTENGYVCGNKLKVEIFDSQRELCCGYTNDSNHYNPSTGT